MKKENKQEESKKKIIINAEDFKGQEDLPKELRVKNTFFNRNLLIPLDTALFKISEAVILFYVKKNKYRKNRYKILINFRIINIIIGIITFFLVAPLGVYLQNTSGTPRSIMFSFSFFYIIGLLLMVGEGLKITHLILKATDYDSFYLFQSNSKHYEIQKFKNHFEFEVEKKHRLHFLLTIMPLFLFFWTFAVIILTSCKTLFDFMALSYLFFFLFDESLCVIDLYIDYIFDFKKPKGKRKKKEVLTKLMEKVFNKLKDSCKVPSPIPIPVNNYDNR